MTETQTREAAPAALPGQEHIAFLDGLRGLAALSVLLIHLRAIQAKDFARFHWTVAPAGAGFLDWLGYGSGAVSVFIVLSGFVLMRPVAQSAARALPGGFWNFAGRRARRILPAYYAALGLAIALILLMHLVKGRVHSAGVAGDDIGALSAGNILAHLLLVQNFNPAWYDTLDAPMWSLPVEWQIYWLFALLLLPLRRRCGMGWTVCAAYGIGFAPVVFTRGGYAWSHPWFLGLFATGMAAASLCFSDSANAAQLRRKVAWGPVLIGLALLSALLRAADTKSFLSPVQIAAECAVGLTLAAFLVVCFCRKHLLAERAVAFLQARPCVALGRFSYSLYLVHLLILDHLWALLSRVLKTPDSYAAGLWGVGIPVCLLASYGFSRLFERPFLIRRVETFDFKKNCATREAALKRV